MFNYKKSIKILKILYKIFIITFLISILKNAIVLATGQPQIPTANVRKINTSTEEYYTSVYIAITILFITINVMVTNFIAMVYQKKTNNKVSKVSKIILIICILLMIFSIILPNMVALIFGKTRTVYLGGSGEPISYFTVEACYGLLLILLICLIILGIIMIYQKIKYKKLSTIQKYITLSCAIVCVMLIIEYSCMKLLADNTFFNGIDISIYY